LPESVRAGGKTEEVIVKARKSAPRRADRSAPPRELSRRRFGQLAMLGLAGGTLMPGELLLGKNIAGGHATAGQEQESAALSAKGRAEVDAKLQAIFGEYGDRLSEDQKKQMRDIVASHVQMLESVRAFPLANPDAPATVLRLVTGERDGAAQTGKAAARSRARNHSRRGR
jgi:hypothetical protein